MRRAGFMSAATFILVGSVVGGAVNAQTKPQAVKTAGKTTRAKNGSHLVSVVTPKPLTENVKRGLAWLAKTQCDNGGWSQGDESVEMGNSLAGLRDKPNVADTCIAALALMRAGSTPDAGPYAHNVRSAVLFVCGQVEESDKTSLTITDIRGTRVQMKLGPYIDTFLASMLLGDVSGQMPDVRSRNRVDLAFHKVMDKIERNQRPDGTWDNQGWAPVLSQAMASKAINQAAQFGYKVNAATRQRAQNYAQAQFDKRTGAFGPAGMGGFGGGAAGVQLYSAASSLGALQDSDNANILEEQKARGMLRSAKTAPERKQAQTALDNIEVNRRDLEQARKAVVGKMNDAQFIAGFGSNGGEEFLSYMNIGESLVVKGGDEWKQWDKKMTANLNTIQNGDGTWSGQHCITGRTFCTAAAILVLTVDRARVPVAQKIRRS